MIKKIKLIYQKGVSLVEAMAAAAVLGLAVVIFVTLQANQESDFATLRKFDKAAYAVELMFDEDKNTTFTLSRSDVPEDTVNKNMATDATENANITFISNSEGSLDPYNDLDMSRFEDLDYIATKTNAKVKTDLKNWGTLLKKHLGQARTGDLRKLDIRDVDRTIPIDADNDGVTDEVAGVDQFEIIQNKQVTITIKQGTIEEKFRRLFLAGT